MKAIKSTKGIYIAVNALAVIFGIVLIIYPAMSLKIMSYLCGSLLILHGGAKILGYFVKDLYNIAFQFDFAIGILAVIFGVIFLIQPTWLAASLPFFIGIFVLISGLFAIQSALDAHRFGLKYWFLLLIFAVLSSLLGGVLIFKPFASSVVLTVFLGIALIGMSIEKIVVCIYTVKTKKTHYSKDENGYREVEFTDV